MIFLSLAWIIAALLAATLCYLALEILLGLVPLIPASPAADKGIGPTASGNGSAVAVIIPAHDEASGIAGTVAALAATAPEARILVVADNCSDTTASLARDAGAEVIERNDPERRGKGFALAYARDHLATSPPSAVIVLDADCRIGNRGVSQLARRTLMSQRPVQASNVLTAALDASPLVQISNFAMLVKNLVRARGLSRIGGGAMLFGTGMSFPWPLFSRLPLATADAVEDLQLGLWLARRGIAVELIDNVQVTSPAASVANSRSQRSRWEHGFLDTARREALPLLLSGLQQRSRHLAALGAHLLVPPLALLMLVAFPIFAVLGVLSVLASEWLPFSIAAAAFAAASLSILLAWFRAGRECLTLTALARAPLYALWKIPIYLGFFNRRQTAWNRTDRDAP